MRLILKVIVGFVVVALLLLAVLLYLEGKDGFNTSATTIWEDVKQVGQSVGDAVNGFFEDTGIKEGAANLLEEGAARIKEGPQESSSPKLTPTPQ